MLTFDFSSGKAKEELDSTKAQMREAEERCSDVELENARLQNVIKELRRAAAASPTTPLEEGASGGGAEGVSVRWVAKHLATTVQDVTHIGGCLAALNVGPGDKAVVSGLQRMQVRCRRCWCNCVDARGRGEWRAAL